MNEQQVIQMKLAQLDYINEQIHELFEFFVSFADEFDGSEYQQGKKDGLRVALSFVSDPSWIDFNRGMRNSRQA